MEIVSDTCLIVRNDKDQSRIPGINYDCFEQIIKSYKGHINITPFSLPELFILRGYADFDKMINDLKKDNIAILDYDFNRLNFDAYKYFLKDRYPSLTFKPKSLA